MDGGVGNLESGQTLFDAVRSGKKNFAGVMFELTARRKCFNYQPHLKARSADDWGGTYWDRDVAMLEGGIAHYRPGKENRYSVDGRSATLVQMWVEQNAHESWSLPF